MRALHIVFAAALAAIPATALAQSPLEKCADQFIGGRVKNVPTIGGSSPSVPFGANRHVCYRDDGVSFFAIEYWPEQFAPRWAAYRLDPAHYGPQGCKTFKRSKANCYFKTNTWPEFQSCEEKTDPFHADKMLTGSKLVPGDFSNTGHDQGHVAPRQAFSWHVCGTYQTFTMANMSPQRAFLNGSIWAHLEEQVLTWAVDSGPLYVVTGTTFGRFPHEKFDVYTNGTLDSTRIYSPGTLMLTAVRQNHANFASHPEGHILRPLRKVNPAKVRDKVKSLRMPTGYYKVVFRPASGTAPAHAIGFLLPHTFENLNKIPGVPAKQKFWSFVARIDVIEAASGTRFPGIPAPMKQVWGGGFFERTGRNIRADSCGVGTPQGLAPNTTKDQRIKMCTDKLN